MCMCGSLCRCVCMCVHLCIKSVCVCVDLCVGVCRCVCVCVYVWPGEGWQVDTWKEPVLTGVTAAKGSGVRVVVSHEIHVQESHFGSKTWAIEFLACFLEFQNLELEDIWFSLQPIRLVNINSHFYKEETHKVPRVMRGHSPRFTHLS